MESALRIKTKVLVGNKVEIELPPGSVGQEVEVFVVLPPQHESRRGDVLDLLDTIRTSHQGRTISEIDRQIQGERESWKY